MNIIWKPSGFLAMIIIWKPSVDFGNLHMQCSPSLYIYVYLHCTVKLQISAQAKEKNERSPFCRKNFFHHVLFMINPFKNSIE